MQRDAIGGVQIVGQPLGLDGSAATKKLWPWATGRQRNRRVGPQRYQSPSSQVALVWPRGLPSRPDRMTSRNGQPPAPRPADRNLREVAEAVMHRCRGSAQFDHGWCRKRRRVSLTACDCRRPSAAAPAVAACGTRHRRARTRAEADAHDDGLPSSVGLPDVLVGPGPFQSITRPLHEIAGSLTSVPASFFSDHAEIHCTKGGGSVF